MIDEIVALNCVRLSLREEIRRIEDRIKELAEANPLTQVKFQTLNTKVGLYVPHYKRDWSQSELRRVIREALIEIMQEE